MEFRPIPKFPGYLARDDGTIWSCKEYAGPAHQWNGRFNGAVWIDSDKPQRELKAFQKTNGYLYVNLCCHGRKSAVRVHRAVCSAFHGLPPSNDVCWEACHNDGNLHNNDPNNLRWATPKDNMRDQYAHKTRAGKLTENQVRMVRDDPRTCRVVAKELGVSHAAISQIRTGKRWKYVQ